jgi:hypothetical protein
MHALLFDLIDSMLLNLNSQFLKQGALFIMKYTRITVKPDLMGGVPCIRGLRIPVATVIGMVAEGLREP